MTKEKIKREIKREIKDIEKEFEISKWKKYGIDEDQAEIYNRGWYEAYRCLLSKLEDNKV